MSYELLSFFMKVHEKDYMNDYTPNGVVVVVVTTVVAAVGAAMVKVLMLFLFHMIFPKILLFVY
ncbi:MAG: hypothetical protein M0D53_17520 [Flavobacterium sp. JAD_PAG50586_2]|nr:MAG: hypothetical protein M0D53_17520 [Flavobacterium sp. JAD_PAG50586_2]